MIIRLVAIALLVVGLASVGCTATSYRGSASPGPTRARCVDQPQRNAPTNPDAAPEPRPLFFLFCVQGP
jgi:hypothetical protein